MIRICDGTDPNLTSRVLSTHFDPNVMTRSPWDAHEKGTDYTIVNCRCGLRFDDTDYQVIYPHRPVYAPGWEMR